MNKIYRNSAIMLFTISIVVYLISAFALASPNATTAFFIVVAHFIAFFIFFAKVYAIQRENDYHDFKKEHPNINGYPEHKFKQFISETPLSVALFILLTAPLSTLVFCISTRKENF